jgi:tetratricopeptide (TPR) repeat protein
MGIKNFKNKNFRVAINYFTIALVYVLTDEEKMNINSYLTLSKQELKRSLQSTKIEEVVKEEAQIEEQPKEETIDKVVDTERVRRHYTQGLYYYRNGYTQKAITEWELAINLEPENERVYTSLQRARALLEKGN